MDNAILIGDIICLYSEDSSGYLYANQSSSENCQIAVGVKQDKERPQIWDQQVISFEVCTLNCYKLNKLHRKLEQQAIANPGDHALKGEVLQAKQSADAENNDNLMEKNRQRGRQLIYGQKIQLRHLFTGKYVHVSTTQTSSSEKNNMTVSLQEENAKHAQFRVMPRYKVKAEGDVVWAGDQIVFESIKSVSQFLHVSRKNFGKISPYESSMELNLSVQPSGFTINKRHRPEPDDNDKVKAGDLIQFFHKEMEAYLVAEGLFDDELTENVHLRVRPVNQSDPKTKMPSTSAITYWQLELEEGPLHGGVLNWEQHCRIIHMTTRMYLTVVRKQGKVDITMTKNHLDIGTLFRLNPVISDSEKIKLESYCRIENVSTGCWLHGLTDEYVRAEQNGSDDTSMAALKWTSAELRQITAQETMQYNDVFSIHGVEQDLVKIFNFVAGIVPVIQKTKNDKKAGVILNKTQTDRLLLAMKELKLFMMVNNKPCKVRQKLLRNLRVVELLVDLLKNTYDTSPDKEFLREIFIEAYSVLYVYLRGNSRKNELYIGKHINFFQKQFDFKDNIGLHSTHMVMELIRDNRKVVDRISTAHIDYFVELLEKQKSHVYLELLSVLCVCDDVSIPDYQQYIAEKWLGKGKNRYVYLTELGENINKTKGVVYISINNGVSWTPLHDFIKNDRIGDKCSFLEHQLLLFGKLCEKRNTFVINMITKKLKYLTWEEAYTCMSDDQLPEEIRAKYCDLMITMFVDVDNNYSLLDSVELTFVYNKLDENKSDAEIDNQNDTRGSATGNYFQILNGWISKFLGENSSMDAFSIGKNKLLTQVLRLVHYLVQYGYYNKENDIKQLLDPLMSLLDGRNDVPFVGADKDKSEDILNQFRLVDRFQKSPSTQAVVDVKLQALEILDTVFNFVFNKRIKRFVGLFKQTQEKAKTEGARRMFEKNSGLTALLTNEYNLEDSSESERSAARKELSNIIKETDLFSQYQLQEILLDLARYDYDEILQKSLYLLSRQFSINGSLFEKTVQAQVLLTDESAETLNALNKMLPKLRRCTMSKMTDKQTQEICTILDDVTKFCFLKNNTTETHLMNQKILYNNGILEDCFAILSQEIDVKLFNQYVGMRNTFKKTFFLLKAMAKGNVEVQERLFNCMDWLLTKEGTEAAMASALTEVFDGNFKTCLKVTGSQIQKIMMQVVRHKEKVPEFLDLLNTLIKVEELNLPLKRNQEYVMKDLMQFRSEIAHVIDQPEENRKEMLTSGNPETLAYFMALVDLLATCAEGENRFIDSVCQKIFTITELVDILKSSEIRNNLKQPFVRFLLAVYLSTADGVMDSDSYELQHSRDFWDYLDSVNAVLSKLTNFSKRQQRKVINYLKARPKRSDLYSDEDSVCHGELYYIFDGVLPLLQIFCKICYQPDPEYPKEAIILTHLASSLLLFAENVSNLITDKQQMSILIDCTAFLLSHSKLSPAVIRDFEEKYGTDSQTKDFKSESKKKYENDHKDEEEINDKLNIFAKNMALTYRGINSVSAQIGYDSNEPYSEDGYEAITLGEEFQKHIQCIVDFKEKDLEKKYIQTKLLIKQLYISQKVRHSNEKDRQVQVMLDVKHMQLLRGIIHNEIVKLPADWQNNTKGCWKQLKVIEQVQNAMNSHNIILSCIFHLSSPQNIIVQELMALLVALLFGGNKNIQDSMLKFFNGTRDEEFFFTIKENIQKSAAATRERRFLHAQYKLKIADVLAQHQVLKKSMLTQSHLSLVSQANVSDNSKKPKGAKSKKNAVNNKISPCDSKGKNIENDESDADVADILKFEDEGHIELTLKMLGYMCDNINRDLQDYLRKQLDNINSINIVEQTTQFLSVLYSSVDNSTMALLLQLFDVLSEFSSGNLQNQAVVFENKICDYINYILRMKKFPGCSEDEIYELKKSIAILIHTLTAENQPKDSVSESGSILNLAKNIFEYLDSENFVGMMMETYQFIKENADSKLLLEYNIKQFTGFAYFHLLLRKMDLLNLSKEDFCKTKENKEAWDYFMDNTYSVELLKDDTLHRIYFTVKDKDILREDVKEKFKYAVDRSNPSNKIQSFMDWAVDIIDDINYHKEISAKPFVRFLVRLWSGANTAVLLLSYLIAILILVFWKQPVDNESSGLYNPVPQYLWPEFPVVMYALGSIHNLLSFVIVLIYFLSNRAYPQFRFIRKNEENITSINLWKSENKMSHLRGAFFSLTTFYYVLFLILSICGTIFHGYFFSFHLLHIVMKNQMLSRVILAVTKNGKSLLLVGFLSLVIFYIYSLVAFAFYRDVFDSSKGRYCTTLYQCLVTIVHHGLVDGLYNSIAAEAEGLSFEIQVKMAFLNVSFFVLITTIGMNIILGIIVDTFSELRNSKWQIDMDMHTCCFICSQESSDFDRQGESFAHHVKKEHNVWAYLFFFIHLSETQRRDYSALEMYVTEQLQDGKYIFFPLKRALCLQSKDDSTDKSTDALRMQIEYLFLQAKKREAEQEKEKEQKRQMNRQETLSKFVKDSSSLLENK